VPKQRRRQAADTRERRKMRQLMAGLLFVLLLSQAAQATAAPVGFTFRKGEKLTYAVDLRTSGSAPGKGTYESDLSGEAVFETLKVRPDGTAEVRMTCSGKGKMVAGSGSLAYEETAVAPILLLVKPDGAISEFRDLNGHKTYLIKAGFDLLNAGAGLRMYLVGTYTMFGLQLPSKTPAPGGKWTGAHKAEHGSGAGGGFDLSKMKVELKSEPILFSLAGTSKYHEVACLTISSPSAVRFDMPGNPHGVAGTWYFDAASGRVVGFESHLKQWGTDKVDFDYTVSLTEVKP